MISFWVVSFKQIWGRNQTVGGLLALNSLWWLNANYSQFYQQNFGIACGFYTPDWLLLCHLVIGIMTLSTAIGTLMETLNLKQGLCAHLALVLSGLLLELMAWHMSMKFGF